MASLMVPHEGSGLVLYDAARHALAKAVLVDEVKGIRAEAEAMRHYARQAKDRKLEADAAAIRLRAERRLGQLMDAQAKAVGKAKGEQSAKGFQKNPLGPPTLDEAGIDKNLADRARKLAALPEAAFDERIEALRETAQTGARIGLDILEPPKQRGTLGTGEVEWYTPPDVIERAREVLGGIDLDPATSLIAQRTVKATRFHTLDDDGLAHEWHGRVWLNPLYAQPAIQHFADKLVDSIEAGCVTSAIALTNDCCDTQWFHRLGHRASAFCLTEGRIRFVAPDGSLAALTQGQVLFYFGADIERFESVFGEVGLVSIPRPSPRSSRRCCPQRAAARARLNLHAGRR
jgi:hypothetical protein